MTPSHFRRAGLNQDENYFMIEWRIQCYLLIHCLFWLRVTNLVKLINLQKANQETICQLGKFFRVKKYCISTWYDLNLTTLFQFKQIKNWGQRKYENAVERNNENKDKCHP